MDDWAESDLAWELADAISPLLADRDRAQLYAIIGSGESYIAIDTVLQTMAHQSLPIATELVTSQVSAGSQGRPSASMTRVSKKCLPCFAAVER